MLFFFDIFMNFSFVLLIFKSYFVTGLRYYMLKTWRRKIFEKKFAGWWIFSDRVAACIAGKFEFKHLKVITFSGVVNSSFTSRLLLTIYRFYTK